MTKRDDIESLKGGMEGRNTIFDKLTVRKDCIVPILPDADSEAASKKYVDDKVAAATQSNVTASRAAGTVYQNTSGKTKLVAITTDLYVYQASGTALVGDSEMLAYCEASTALTTMVQMSDMNINMAGLGSGVHSVDTYIPIVFIVPNNFYYKLEKYKAGADGQDPAIQIWFEYTLG